jgi:hypothetical protein
VPRITNYYVPNKIANSYVANKRTEGGEYVYDAQISDAGMETQAAIQSLNKSYSNVVNDAYINYLNSKQNILTSNLGQGYKEKFIQQEEANLRANIQQADLSAASTKQQLLETYAEQESAIGKAFQTEVLNMEKVDTLMSSYADYLKTVKNGGISYFDAIIKGKGLENVNASIGVKAEDIYDALYNAAPIGYMTDQGEAALNWRDWLSSQIRTEKDQAWYDWYKGQGGEEQFIDAYQKGVVGMIAKYIAEQAEKARQQQLRDAANTTVIPNSSNATSVKLIPSSGTGGKSKAGGYAGGGSGGGGGGSW